MLCSKVYRSGVCVEVSGHSGRHCFVDEGHVDGVVRVGDSEVSPLDGVPRCVSVWGKLCCLKVLRHGGDHLFLNGRTVERVGRLELVELVGRVNTSVPSGGACPTPAKRGYVSRDEALGGAVFIAKISAGHYARLYDCRCGLVHISSKELPTSVRRLAEPAIDPVG